MRCTSVLATATLLCAVACNWGIDCDELTADMETCLDEYCDYMGIDHAFCDCWDQGMDMSAYDCSCVAWEPDVVCDYYNETDMSVQDFNCYASQEAMANICN